jgi:hypothetical protein
VPRAIVEIGGNKPLVDLAVITVPPEAPLSA